MKTTILTALLVALLFILTNCSSSSDPAPQLTEEEVQINKLSKTWVLGTVVYTDDDVTDRFDDFSLTFTKSKTYTAAGSLGDYDFEPFKASGTWDFKSGDLNVITRNDGVNMEVSVTDNALFLTFNMTEANGRLAGLGSYRFDLVTK